MRRAKGGIWGRTAGCPQGERWRNEAYVGAGGEQTAQIISLSSGMERQKRGGWVEEIYKSGVLATK